jgi:ankyrin repeat protein
MNLPKSYSKNERIQNLIKNLDTEGGINKVDEDGLRPIDVATLFGQLELVKILLEKGASASPFADGSSPLHLASALGHLGIVQLLLESPSGKSALNAKQMESGRCPIHWAVQEKQLPIIKFLISSGANIEVQCIDGITPLQAASSGNDFECVKLLLESGANPNALCIDKEKKNHGTALHAASAWNSIESAEALLAHGADVESRDEDGLRPIDFAIMYDLKEMIKLLSQRTNPRFN